MNWRIKRLIDWLGELKPFYFAMIPVLLAAVSIYFLNASEPSIRISGLLLQIIGIGSVIWGISKTRSHFGHPSSINIFLAWLRRFPLIRRNAYIEPEGINLGASLVGVKLTSVFTPNPDAALDERLKVIEKGIETLQNRIGDTEHQIDQYQSTTDGKILVEERTRKNEDKKIMSSIESFSTGGLYISAIGALWLFVGVVLSTASPEISRLLG